MRSRFDMKSHSTLRHKTHRFHSSSVAVAVVAVEGHNNSDSHNTKTDGLEVPMESTLSNDPDSDTGHWPFGVARWQFGAERVR